MPPFRPRRRLRPIRPRLTRRALLWYAAAVGLTLTSAVVVDSSLRRVEAAEAALGATRPVAVVARRVAAGDEVDGADVRIERWPASLVPDEALGEAPTGEVALVDLLPGEPVLGARVGTSGVVGPAALLADGQRAVAVPVVVAGLRLAVGDRVDVLVGGGVGGGPAGDLPTGGSGPDVVAGDATVVAVGDTAVVVAVRATEAPLVAAALTVGPVVLALRPPGG